MSSFNVCARWFAVGALAFSLVQPAFGVGDTRTLMGGNPGVGEFLLLPVAVCDSGEQATSLERVNQVVQVAARRADYRAFPKFLTLARNIDALVKNPALRPEEKTSRLFTMVGVMNRDQVIDFIESEGQKPEYAQALIAATSLTPALASQLQMVVARALNASTRE